MKNGELYFELYKDGLFWNDKDKMWVIDFYHEDKRIRKRSTKWIKSKKWLAEEALLEICMEIASEQKRSVLTLDEIFEEYMRFKNARPITKDNDRYTYNKHISPYLGSKNIDSITIQDIIYFKDNLITSKKSDGSYYENRTVDGIESITRQIFDYAESFDYLDKNLMRRVQKFKTNRPDTDFSRRYVEYDSVLKVLDMLSKPKYRVALAISLYTAMRPSEIFGLDIKDDMGKKFYMRQTWDSRNKAIGPPKNNKRRYVPIPDPLRKELDNYYSTLKGYEITPDSPLIGITRRQSKSSIDKALATAIAKAGVSKFSWYDIRSTMITNSLKLGADPFIVAKNAGHSQAMTTDTYAQVDIEDQQRVTDTLYKSLNNLSKKI